MTRRRSVILSDQERPLIFIDERRRSRLGEVAEFVAVVLIVAMFFIVLTARG